MGHPVTSGGTFGLLSGENPRGPTETTPTHENLINHLKQMGLKHEVVQGHYGSPETSVLVHNPTRDQMVSLGKRFGQESVIHSSGGKHELVYTHGPDAGKVHTANTHEFFKEPPKDFYTELPGHGHFRINFDFSKPPQLPVISKGMGADVSDKLYTVEEAQAELQKATREKVEALAKTLTELQVRELAKSKKLDKNLVPPHKHAVGSSVSGTEDVAMGKLNPPGKNDPIKTEKAELEDSAHGDEESSGEKSVADIRADAKERMSLCKCGGELYKNEMCKGCFEKSAMAKSEGMKACDACGAPKAPKGETVCSDCKGKAKSGKQVPAVAFGDPKGEAKLDKGQLIEAKDATPHPVPAEGGKVIPSPGSGSAPKANKSLKMLRDSAKAKAKMAKSEEVLAKGFIGEAVHGRDETGEKTLSHKGHTYKITEHSAANPGGPGVPEKEGHYEVHHKAPGKRSWKKIGDYSHPVSAEVAASHHFRSETAPKTEKAEPPMAKPPSTAIAPPKLKWMESEGGHVADHPTNPTIHYDVRKTKHGHSARAISKHVDKHLGFAPSASGAKALAHQHFQETHALIEKAKAASATQKAEPPMAKPPSGVNMATHVPVSKPKAPVVKEALPDVKPGKPAQMKHPYVAGLGVQKGDFGLGDSGKAATLPAPSAAAPENPKPKFTGADLNAAKAKLGKPGIFGRIGKKPNNQ